MVEVRRGGGDRAAVFTCKAGQIAKRLDAVEIALAEVLEAVREIRQEQRILAEAKATEIGLGVQYEPPLRPRKRSQGPDRG